MFRHDWRSNEEVHRPRRESGGHAHPPAEQEAARTRTRRRPVARVPGVPARKLLTIQKACL